MRNGCVFGRATARAARPHRVVLRRQSVLQYGPAARAGCGYLLLPMSALWGPVAPIWRYGAVPTRRQAARRPHSSGKPATTWARRYAYAYGSTPDAEEELDFGRDGDVRGRAVH